MGTKIALVFARLSACPGAMFDCLKLAGRNHVSARLSALAGAVTARLSALAGAMFDDLLTAVFNTETVSVFAKLSARSGTMLDGFQAVSSPNGGALLNDTLVGDSIDCCVDLPYILAANALFLLSRKCRLSNVYGNINVSTRAKRATFPVMTCPVS